MKTRLFAALCTCAAFALPAAALAGETRVYIGADVAGGRQNDALFHLTGIDGRAPIFAIRHDSGAVTIAVDHVPVDTAYLGRGERLSLGYTQGNVQLWNRTRRFGVAAGETLYFLQDTYAAGAGAQHFATRSAGAAFGVLASLPAGPHATVTASVFDSPSMHQRATEWVSTGVSGSPDFAKGSMADAMLAVDDRFSGRASLSYGLRYFNYSGGRGAIVFGYPGRIRSAALGAFAAFGLRLR